MGSGRPGAWGAWGTSGGVTGLAVPRMTCFRRAVYVLTCVACRKPGTALCASRRAATAALATGSGSGHPPLGADVGQAPAALHQLHHQAAQA